jgi:hypothetical protein
MVIDPWAYRLKPYLWTSIIAWCAILAALSWLMSHWRPRQRGLVITLFLVPQIGLRVPFVWTNLTDWLRDPGNPISFYSLIWYLIVTLIAIPFSVILGAGNRNADRAIE